MMLKYRFPAYMRLRDPFPCRGTWERKRPIIDTIVRRHKTPPCSPSAPSVVQLLHRAGSAGCAPRLLLAQ